MKRGEADPRDEGIYEYEPYLPIAKALKEEVDARLLGDTSGIISVDEAWDKALQAVAEKVIDVSLRDLPTDQLLAFYLERFGDDEYAAKLKELVEFKAADAERLLKLERIQQEVKHTRLLKLDNFEPNQVLRLFLFDPMHADSAFKGSTIPPKRQITFRLTNPTLGESEIINDTLMIGMNDGDMRGKRVVVGKMGDGRELEPVLGLGSPLYYLDKADLTIKATKQINGYVETIDGVLVADSK